MYLARFGTMQLARSWSGPINYFLRRQAGLLCWAGPIVQKELVTALFRDGRRQLIVEDDCMRLMIDQQKKIIIGIFDLLASFLEAMCSKLKANRLRGSSWKYVGGSRKSRLPADQTAQTIVGAIGDENVAIL